MNTYTEDALIEQPAIALFSELGWETANLFYEKFGPGDVGTEGRETTNDVVLVPRLRAALRRLNPTLPDEALVIAIQELTRDRSSLSPAYANREVYRLVKDGVKVAYRNEKHEETVETVRVIDWGRPEENSFFLASQFWVSGDMYKRRADLVGFVNGLPLVFIELKAVHKNIKDAYEKNLRDYKDTIPQIFWYNAFIILSNGSRSRIGSMTADWEHFSEWKKLNDEGEEGIVSLDTMIRGTCDKSRLLDVMENFILFSEERGGLAKRVARNHQYLGVNRAIESVQSIGENRGRLGVFWHTQGSGKSYSMVFFSQKVLRKLPGSWTFLVVTDREDLDDQIYKNFADAGVVTEKQSQVQASSGKHLKLLLREDHRYIFTLIQKFHTERGQTYPMLSDRSDIIVITDEAHRSQYDVFALNMRNALPNAAFIGFTGTPLMAGEEKTKEVFGDYVSVYNFKQSIDDGATVPLYYENRIPELQLANEDLNEDMEALGEAAGLDDEQEQVLEREFERQYHLITRDDRLEKIAEDMVSHFMGRGHLGKAMVISIDKMTAVRMYDKVQKHWKGQLHDLRAWLAGAETQDEKDELSAKVRYMEETDMAVVVSPAQNEIEDFRRKGLDIATHRKRMLTEDLDTKFKDPANPLRIVFLCAMWMTGFDAPAVSTIYLDKPMRNHTLMQTIARSNRVFGDKHNGLIVDYIGVFRDLQRALAIYGSSSGAMTEGDMPVKDKSELVAVLRQAITEMDDFLAVLGINPQAITGAEGFKKVKLLGDAVEALLVNDTTRNRYFALVSNISRLFKAILPDRTANEFWATVTLYSVISDAVMSDKDPTDISAIMDGVEGLLDKSIVPTSYVIRDRPEEYGVVDLNQLDFDRLRTLFEHGRKYTATQRLRDLIEAWS